jgi:hypothetical protein
LLLVEDVDTAFLAGWWWNTSWEVSQLVELIKVLSSLQQYLLIFSQMIIWIHVCIPQNGDILLQVPDLIIEINELLGLLLNQ